MNDSNINNNNNDLVMVMAPERVQRDISRRMEEDEQIPMTELIADGVTSFDEIIERYPDSMLMIDVDRTLADPEIGPEFKAILRSILQDSAGTLIDSEGQVWVAKDDEIDVDAID